MHIGQCRSDAFVEFVVDLYARAARNARQRDEAREFIAVMNQFFQEDVDDVRQFLLGQCRLVCLVIEPAQRAYVQRTQPDEFAE